MTTITHRPARVDVQAATDDSLVLPFTVVDAAGNAVDVSGWTVEATQAAATIVDGPNGRIDVDFDTATEGNRGDWLLRRTSPDGRYLLGGQLFVSTGAVASPSTDSGVTVKLDDASVTAALGDAVDSELRDTVDGGTP